MAVITWIVDGESVEDGTTNRPLRQFITALGLDPDVDITGIPWLNILGTPATVAGYGINDVYTDAEVDTLLTGKSDTGHTHTFASLTSKPTTLAGYGITDAYTDAEVDTLLAGKAALAHTHDAPDDLVPGTGAADFNVLQQDGVNLALQPFRVENRTSDPGAPAVGQIWLRTDL